MKQIFAILLGLMLVMPAMVHAGDDRAFTFEILIGLGKESEGNKGFAFRLRQDNVEGHVAHWWGKSKNTAVGLGLVGDTEENGTRGNEDWHASITGGISYVFNTDPLLGPPSTSPFVSHFQPFFRGAVGHDLTANGDLEVEFSYSRYGFEVGEQFGGFGFKHNNRYDNEYDEGYVGSSSTDEVPCDGVCDDEGSGDGGPPDGNPGDDGNNGHGNDEDCFDDTNPGNSEGCR